VSELRLFKECPNRHLYDVRTSSCITLQGIYRFVTGGIELLIVDHPSGLNITHSVLIQVLIELESTGGARLSNTFLTDLIRSGGATTSGDMAYHLEQAIKNHLELTSPSAAERPRWPHRAAVAAVPS
jgi:polyhydroxyalkanoate synthesis repressor PhaR